MATNEQQTPEHPPRPNWNARETAIVLSLGLLLLSVVIDFMVDQKLDWRAFLADLPPNIVGALIVFWMFEWMYSRRQQEEHKAQEAQEATEQLKRGLIMRMGSQVNDTAVSAANELRAWGWLEDGSLKGANLFQANLEGAGLNLANLQEANLFGTNLEEANLSDINLQGAFLTAANLGKANLSTANLEGANLFATILEGANLSEASLQRANLVQANLQGANLGLANLEGVYLSLANLQGANLGSANLQAAGLWNAKLQGINLWRANLRGADLRDSKFSEDTTLPDGTKWAPDTDMTRFTDPNHPNFWRLGPGFTWGKYWLEEAQHGDE